MRNKKNIVIVSMCVAVLFMVVVFAALQTRLTISGVGSVKGKWQIEITKIESTPSGTAYNIEEPVFSATNVTFNAGLKKPGDKVTYHITVENKGSINAIIDEVQILSNNQVHTLYTVNGIEEGITMIPKGQSITFDFDVEFNRNMTYIPEDGAGEVNVTIVCVQEQGQGIIPGNPIVETIALSDAILRDNTAKDGNDIMSISEAGGSGLYYTTTGTEGNELVYFYRDVTNNYVTFAEEDVACKVNGLNVGYVVDYDSKEVTQSPTEEQCLSTNVCVGSTVGMTREQCYEQVSTLMSVFPEKGISDITCEYKGLVVDYVTEVEKIDLTEEECTSNYVCVRFVSDFQANVALVGPGITETTCTQMSGTWTNEKATYVGPGGYEPYKGKATYGGTPITWRILRINEDGSIRIVKHTDIGSYAFNQDTDSYNASNAYVGYMYGSPLATTYEENHENINKSIIYEVLTHWYVENFLEYSYMFSNNAGFCNDRSFTTGTGAGKNTTNYAFINRIFSDSGAQFACPQQQDLFTRGDSTIGNGKLEFPIGLISADEVVFYGGGVNGIGGGEKEFWTMTPSYFDERAYVISVMGSEFHSSTYVATENSVYPVVNLKSTTQITGGTGTSGDPYVVYIEK